MPQWVLPLQESCKKPGGREIQALRISARRPTGLTGFIEEYKSIDYKRVKDSCPEMDHLQSFFNGNNFLSRDLPNEQVLDWDGLRGRLRSNSFTPVEGHPNYAPMMKEVERIFRAHEQDGRVRMQYWTRLYFGQLEVR